MRLRDKVAIVTGGGQGIGRGIALMFAREGAKLAIAQRTEARLAQTKAEIEAMGGQVLSMAIDVGQPEEVKALVEATVERFGGLDILVNNAGTGLWVPIDEVEEEDCDRLMNTNLKGMLMGCHYAVPHMKARGGGSIINISSVHGILGGERNAVYAATKGGIIGSTRAQAAELAPFNIRANAISPGAIEVRDLLERALLRVEEEHREEFVRRFGDRVSDGSRYFQPLEKVGKPEDIAWCAVYLASDEAGFVTGQNIAVDGGITTFLSGYENNLERNRQAEASRVEIQTWIEAHAATTTSE